MWNFSLDIFRSMFVGRMEIGYYYNRMSGELRCRIAGCDYGFVLPGLTAECATSLIRFHYKQAHNMEYIQENAKSPNSDNNDTLPVLSPEHTSKGDANMIEEDVCG